VKADARKLRQAVSNLIGNAVKFSSHGGEVLVEMARTEGKLQIVVYDQGPGIPAGDQEHVFEPLFHAIRTSHSARGTEARRPGSGLGLPVARRIAEAHGGRIFLESPPATPPRTLGHAYGGTRVTLEIPAPPPGG
jgi:signal transduction histidine kinase